MKKNFFLTTRRINGIYNFLLKPCIVDAEKKIKNNLILKEFKNKFYLRAIFFTLFNIFNLTVFNRNRLVKLNLINSSSVCPLFFRYKLVAFGFAPNEEI